MKNNNKTTNTYVRAPLLKNTRKTDTTVPNVKSTHGITLIALVITIIILLILAGIVINLTIGENGIIKKAQQAGINYEEAGAREKLELALVDLQAQKVIDSTYNETTYIDSYLGKKQMIVVGDKVTVDGWQFEIDRSVPKIVIGLGKGQVQESTTITIKTAVTNAVDYTKATIQIEITSDEDIGSIQINGEEITVPTKTDGKYIVEKEVENNGNYIINVKNTKNEYKIGKVEVTEISEDMDIETVEQLVAFRNRVNKGATYKGRTIRLVNDLNLSGVCGETKGNWEPIGKYISDDDYKTFKGTFEGNNHTIDYLYINTTDVSQGLFGCAENGTIKGTIIGKNSCITGDNWTGGIVGWISGSTIQNCENNGAISGSNWTGGIVGWTAGSTIQNCGNNGLITSTGNNVAGIVGEMDNSDLEGCYNKENVTANTCVGGIVGYVWVDQNGKYYLKNSYNEGNITAGSFAGGITGTIDTDDNASIDATISNCYNKGIITVTETGRVGGITARVAGNILIEYCCNIGNITQNGGTNVTAIGGIVGMFRLTEGVASDSVIKAVINQCLNTGNVISTVAGSSIGGIVGVSREDNCYVKNAVQLRTALVKNNTITATGRMGTSSNSYTGRLIGRCYNENTPYIENVYQSDEADINTVYDVLNEFSENASAYWSNDDVNAPKLLWER